jgi:hypothetical protein
MRSPARRNSDLRKIRTNHVYTLSDLAKDVDRKVATVRCWIKDGLPTIDGSSPVLLDGSEVRLWLADKRRSKKRPCGPGELFCCKCQRPRKPSPGSVQLKSRNQLILIIRGSCSICGTTQSQASSMARIKKTRLLFGLSAKAIQHLLVCDKPSTNSNIVPLSVARKKTANRDSQLTLFETFETAGEQSRPVSNSSITPNERKLRHE